MADAIPTLGRQLPFKVLDWELAQFLGRSVETVRSYRTGRLRIPADVRARMLQWRAERAIEQIAEGRAELARIVGEARANGIDLSEDFERLLQRGRELDALCALGRSAGAEAGPAADVEEAPQ